jgi:hypothetical protein
VSPTLAARAPRKGLQDSLLEDDVDIRLSLSYIELGQA